MSVVFVMYVLCGVWYFFCFKQKTAYEMRISDWSSDVCSSDLKLTTPICPPPVRSLFTLATGRVSSGSWASWVAAACTTVSLPSTSTCTASRPSKRRRPKSGGTPPRSEERRVGKECVSTGRSGWSQYKTKKNTKTDKQRKLT